MKKTSIGGQAVIEGVMMRGPESIAIAVRKMNKEIVVEKKEYIGFSKKYKVLNVPLVRGVIAFFESLVVGARTLIYSAEVFEIEEENEKGEVVNEPEKEAKTENVPMALIMLSVALALVFGVVLFVIAPNYIAGFLEKRIPNPIILNLIEGIIRILIFFLYIFAISKMKDIQRVFEYHGAEHKTIFCYESGKDLNVENVRGFTRLHPRCGTSFLLIVMVVSIIVFSFAGWNGIVSRIISRLLLLPLVAGLSYEIIKWAGRSESKLSCYVSKPGMWFQKLTTREPDDEQIEVAITALKNVLTEDKEADLW